MRRQLHLGALPKRQKGECRWCGASVSGRRRTWCSDECVRQYQIRASAATARHEVFRRDRGVCVLCRLETEVVKPRLEAELRRRIAEGPPLETTRWRVSVQHGDILMTIRIHYSGWPLSARLPALWQADHIIPVAEGGGACGLDNLRTLCWRCHPRETGALRRRLNRRRARPDVGRPANEAGATTYLTHTAPDGTTGGGQDEGAAKGDREGPAGGGVR
jgi:5-methylcytosine-specific restriction endonuclease McrA